MPQENLSWYSVLNNNAIKCRLIDDSLYHNLLNLILNRDCWSYLKMGAVFLDTVSIYTLIFTSSDIARILAVGLVRVMHREKEKV